MTYWGVINVTLSITAVVVIVWKITCHSPNALLGERIGSALIAAGLTLIIAQIVVNSGKPWLTKTPFDGWSTSMLRIGLILHFGTRIFVHTHRNWVMIRMMRRELLERKAKQ